MYCTIERKIIFLLIRQLVREEKRCLMASCRVKRDAQLVWVASRRAAGRSVGPGTSLVPTGTGSQGCDGVRKGVMWTLGLSRQANRRSRATACITSLGRVCTSVNSSIEYIATGQLHCHHVRAS